MPLPFKYSLRSLLVRKHRTALTALGIALAVLVALLMMALAQGIASGVRSTGHPLNVLVTAKGAETIEFSALDPNTYEILRHAPEVAVSPSGHSLASPEVFFSSHFQATPNTPPTQALIRGVLPIALDVHDQVSLTAGRFPQGPGEILVGPLVATALGLPQDATALGQTLLLEGHPWTIVGHFAAPSTVFEAEIWALLGEIMATSRRAELNSVVLRAADEAAFEELLFDLETRTDILAASRAETSYYAAYADSFRPVSDMVSVVAILLAAGGAFIGMNTLYASVASRTREIGMLRILGFRRWHIALSLALEGVLPALLGAVVASIAALTFHGLALRIPMGAFRLSVTPSLLALGLLLGVTIGILGSLLGVYRAVRLKTVQAIHHS